jgi:hypothetical protein
MLDCHPDDVLAIVVGVDHYDYGGQWELKGPVRDAVNTVDWLLKQNVPTGNIALFLSPRSWDDADVKALLASAPGLPERAASDHALSNYINEELPGKGGKALLVHWGGHGVAGDDAPRQYMYTSNAAQGRPYCVCAEELAAALADQRLRHLRHQMLIFDVCANQRGPSNESARLAPARFVHSGYDAGVVQCHMYAASLGKYAANSPDRGVGLFSELLFCELRRLGAPGMRQFIDVFKALVRDGEHNGLSKQVPLLKAPGEHQLPLVDAAPVRPQDALFDRIGALELAPARLDRLYLQSLSHVDVQSIPLTLEERLFDLTDTRPQRTSLPSPIVEFAERLGHELAAPDLREWARGQCKPGQYRELEAKLEREARTGNREPANLFIEVASDDAHQFSWWLEGPELPATGRQAVAVDGAGLHDTLVSTLPRILAHAEKLVRHLFQLRIGFILPVGLLLAGLERIRIQLDPQDLPTPLNELYPVLFHWVQRTLHSGTRDVNMWASLIDTLAPRAALGHGTEVVWLGQGAADERARYVRASAALSAGPEAALCLGIGHPPEELAPSRLETVRQSLKAGVPCLFWLQQPAAAADADALRERVNQAFARHAPRNAPVAFLLAQLAVDAAQRFGIDSLVWDLPSHLPAHTPSLSLFEDHL